MRPGQPIHRDQALRLAIVIERQARTQAHHWTRQLPEQAALIGRGRAERVVDTTGVDPLRAALTREWFARVFEDETRKQLGRLSPQTAVTPTETEHVAECLRTGTAYRIHGPDGAVVLNPNSPTTVPGQNNFHTTPTGHDPGPEHDETWHHNELTALAAAQDQRRADADKTAAATWDQLSPEQRTAFATYWHRETTPRPGHQPTPTDHTPPPPATPEQPTLAGWTAFSTGRRTPVTGPPAKAAAEVFAKQPPTIAHMNAARALSAASFPQRKPNLITPTGHERKDATNRAKQYGTRQNKDAHHDLEK